MDICGFQWISADIHGCPWISMDIHGNTWIFMDIHGKPWISIDMYGPPLLIDQVFIIQLAGARKDSLCQRERGRVNDKPG